MKKYNWENKDWYWLLFTLVYTFGFFIFDDDEILSLLSYAATAVSIALALVAIYISLKEALKTDDTKTNIERLLGKLDEKIAQVDGKVNNIDLKLINQFGDRQTYETLKRIKKVIQESVNDIATQQLLIKATTKEITETSELIKERVKYKMASNSIEIEDFSNDPLGLIRYEISVTPFYYMDVSGNMVTSTVPEDFIPRFQKYSQEKLSQHFGEVPVEINISEPIKVETTHFNRVSYYLDLKAPKGVLEKMAPEEYSYNIFNRYSSDLDMKCHVDGILTIKKEF
ncbi:hypothetical protein [Paenibacillus alkalitolerans]|uniref:hypothetical protein n=1 Tax=Paenibacillus alkalitolerans TaxID=2799335 RepID=UPI0018F516CD|nr:hypothetical protein [Paenibacillus alkalitolerans]